MKVDNQQSPNWADTPSDGADQVTPSPSQPVFQPPAGGQPQMPMGGQLTQPGQAPYGTPPPGYGTPPPGYGQAPTGYAPPPYGYAPVVAPTSGLAIGGFVCSLLGCGIFSIIAIVLCHKAQQEIKTGMKSGRGLALAGTIIGWIGLAGFILWLVFFVILASSAPLYYYS